ncbi:MAG: hypothetical protein IKD04_08350 [Clostridia bacterium]|nr:hypothetical protein [Clostridia bacterium]
MKKLLSVITAFSVGCLLCGCSLKEALSPYTQEYIVSSLGFEAYGDTYSISLEVLMINSEDKDAQKLCTVIKGMGENPREALYNASKSSALPLLLSHCGVAIIGESIEKEHFEEIHSFLTDNTQITPSVYLIYTQSAEALLGCEATSSVAVGYDIMNMLNTRNKADGEQYSCRLYEIDTLKNMPINTFCLPFFEVTDNGFLISGGEIFYDNSPALSLTPQQMTAYLVTTSSQGSGEILLNGQAFWINSYNTQTMFYMDSVLKINLTLNPRPYNQRLCSDLKTAVADLLRLSVETGKDIFGFGNIIYRKEKALWKRIKDSYPEYYKNCKFTVDAL